MRAPQRRRRPSVLPWVLFSLSLAAVLTIGAAMFEQVSQPALHAPIAPRPQSAPAPVFPNFGATTAQRPALIMPVDGVAPDGMSDTWGQARAEGRAHEGVDILAPEGAPVRAAVDGRIVKFFDSVRGGVTIYQFDRAERFVYYYAHLQRRAPALREGDSVLQGDVIGYVGMTGNAPIPHLHFEIQRLTPERQWWRAESLNPYPYLRAGQPPSR